MRVFVRWRRTATVVGAAVLAAAALVACGDDGSDGALGAGAGLDRAPGPGGEGPGLGEGSAGSGGPGGEVPDPCEVVSAGELAGILGSAPGEGTTAAVVPDQRKVCVYDSGLSIGIELGSHYEQSIGMMEGMGTLEDVSGVGNRAVWFDLGPAGTLVALGDDYMVDVTVITGQDSARQVASAVLAAL